MTVVRVEVERVNEVADDWFAVDVGRERLKVWADEVGINEAEAEVDEVGLDDVEVAELVGVKGFGVTVSPTFVLFWHCPSKMKNGAEHMRHSYFPLTTLQSRHFSLHL